MQLSDIRRIAQYQDDNWDSQQGYIDEVDLGEGFITFEGQEYKISPNARKETLKILGLNGTARDFEDDQRFLQLAVIRKTARLEREHQIIYDSKTNEAKGIKGINYEMISNVDVMDKALSRYPDHFNPKGSHIGDERMVLRFTDIEKAVIEAKSVGDPVSFGALVWNGITTSLGVGQDVTRLACTNGMLSRERQDIVRLAHNQLELMPKLDEGLVMIMRNKKILAVMARAVDRPPIVRNLLEEGGRDSWSSILSRYSIPRRHHHGIFRAHETEEVGRTEDGVNGWGVYNAVTRYNSHEYRDQPTYDFNESMAILTNAYSFLTL